MTRYILFLLLSGLIWNCQEEEEVIESPIEITPEQVWSARMLTQENRQYTIRFDVELLFKSNQNFVLSSYDDSCNGSYTVAAEVNKWDSVELSCLKESNHLPPTSWDRIVTIIETMEHYEIVGERLTFYSKEGNSIVFLLT